MRLLRFLVIATALLGTTLSGASSDLDLEISWELRWPANERLQEHIGATFIHDSSGLVSTPLKRDWIKSDGAFSTYSWGDSARNEKRRLLVLKAPTDEVVRVFQLNLPTSPHCTEWSPWESPIYMSNENGHLLLDLLNGLPLDATSTQVIPLVEIRYRIESSSKKC